MSRKVSVWIVVALLGALAAMTTAVVVLATQDDDEARTTTGRSQGYGWSNDESGRQGDSDSLVPSGPRGAGQIPLMSEMHDPWHRDGGASTLPWVLFALATGTSVGLLIAWSPWRAARTAGPNDGEPGESDTATTAPAPSEDEAAATPYEDEARTSAT